MYLFLNGDGSWYAYSYSIQTVYHASTSSTYCTFHIILILLQVVQQCTIRIDSLGTREMDSCNSRQIVRLGRQKGQGDGGGGRGDG